MPRVIRVSALTSALALLCALSARAAGAQPCLGRPYFSTARMQLGAGAEFGNNATMFGGEAALGKERGLFARVNVTHEENHPGGVSTAGDPSGMTFGGSAGYQLALGHEGRVQMCPFAAANWGSLDFGGDQKLKRSLVQVGATVGLSRPSNAEFHIVPFAGIAFAQLSRDFNASASTESLGTDNYFPLTIGAGLHFKSSFMIVGDVTIPIDLGGGDPSVGLRLVLPLGGRR